MKKVNILMPTYNGEKYIKYQLDSVINQTYKNIDVYIRDDGSTDSTREIIREYCEKEVKGIRFFYIESNGINLGYPDCFWELVKQSGSADYYSFCDQDDYWEPTKIESAILQLEKLDSSKPALCFCRFDYYDSNMDYIRDGEDYSNRNLEFKNGMYYTFAPGFSQVVNKALIDQLDINYLFNKNIAHDLWCQWIATALGTVVYDKTIQARYRRHASAVTSANENILSSIKQWWSREINGTGMITWKNCLRYFYDLYGNKLNSRDSKLFHIFVKDKNTILTSIRKCFYLHRFRPGLGGEIALRILFILQKC